MAGTDGTRRRRTQRRAVRLDRSAVSITYGRHVEHRSVEAEELMLEKDDFEDVSGFSKCETKLQI